MSDKRVPREPTQAMAIAMDDAWLEAVRVEHPQGWEPIWRAGYDAARVAQEGERQEPVAWRGNYTSATGQTGGTYWHGDRDKVVAYGREVFGDDCDMQVAPLHAATAPSAPQEQASNSVTRKFRATAAQEQPAQDDALIAKLLKYAGPADENSIPLLDVMREAAAEIAALRDQVAERDDKIRQLRIIANVNGDWNLKYGAAVDRANAAESLAKEQQGEIERARADAARYRWLRDNDWVQQYHDHIEALLNVRAYDKHRLDAAVDAALADAQPSPKDSAR